MFSVLLWPQKDPARELWDGPRSGAVGAVSLTGVDRAYETEQLSARVGDILRQAGGDAAVWYERRRPAHPGLDSTSIAALLDARGGDKQVSRGKQVRGGGTAGKG